MDSKVKKGFGRNVSISRLLDCPHCLGSNFLVSWRDLLRYFGVAGRDLGLRKGWFEF